MLVRVHSVILSLMLILALPFAAQASEFSEFETLFNQTMERYLDVAAICNGRLTLTTGVPVTTADVSAAGVVYFTPYQGAKVSLYDGTRWKLYPFSEISLALSVSSGSNYDVFLYDNAGVLTLELSAAWSSDTARNNAISLQDGVYVKTSATTRRYLGTLRGSGANVTEDSATKRFLWNYYNRKPRNLEFVTGSVAWSYNVVSWRAAGTDTNARLQTVQGLAEDIVEIVAETSCSSPGGTSATIGIGLDKVNGNDASSNGGCSTLVASDEVHVRAEYRGVPTQGFHFFQWVETNSVGTGATTFQGSGTNLKIGVIRGRVLG